MAQALSPPPPGSREFLLETVPSRVTKPRLPPTLVLGELLLAKKRRDVGFLDPLPLLVLNTKFFLVAKSMWMNLVLALVPPPLQLPLPLLEILNLQLMGDSITTLPTRLLLSPLETCHLVAITKVCIQY